MVKFLLANGVLVNVQNELGYSPLHQVTYSTTLPKFLTTFQP